MDEIKLEIVDCDLDDHVKNFDIKVTLNGQTLPHSFFNTHALVASSHKTAFFDLFTCSCGEAGCAGFFEPVMQVKNDTIVTWTFPDDQSYKVVKLVYEFDTKDFDTQFELIRNKMFALEKEDSYLLHFINLYMDRDEDTPVKDQLKGQLVSYFEEKKKYYEAVENFNIVLSKNFPVLMKTNFHLGYKNTISTDSINFSDLVSCMLNDFPKAEQEDGYLDRAIEAGNAIVTILEKNSQPFIDIVYNSYKRFGDNQQEAIKSLWSRFPYPDYVIDDISDFNLDDIYITAT